MIQQGYKNKTHSQIWVGSLSGPLDLKATRATLRREESCLSRTLEKLSINDAMRLVDVYSRVSMLIRRW